MTPFSRHNDSSLLYPIFSYAFWVMNFPRKKGYEILRTIKANVKDKKVKAMGLSKMRVIFPLKIIKVCRTLFSVIGPNTTPIIKGAIGKFHFLEKAYHPGNDHDPNVENGVSDTVDTYQTYDADKWHEHLGSEGGNASKKPNEW